MPVEVKTVELATGTLTLFRQSGPSIEGLCDFAARANPKRGYLIVSKVLGRHVPARPRAMRKMMDDLAALVPHDLPQPILFLGMAETATGLGQGVFAAHRRLHPQADAVYVQSSRQRVFGSEVLATFEEGHSHATTHLVQVVGDDVVEFVHRARTLVIIDDECSTGKTFLAAAEALAAVLPNLEQVETCCITDWSDQSYRERAILPCRVHALLVGELEWASKRTGPAAQLAQNTDSVGKAPATGMRSRTGLIAPEKAVRQGLSVRPGDRVLVLGEGEHSYEALLLAEEIELAGGIAAVQCITRSPALLGGAMTTVSNFTDAYGSGAPCFLYNIDGHAPDVVAIVTEQEGHQKAEAIKALLIVGSTSRVECVACTYDVKAA